jgi:hypothetical protein
MAALAVAFAGLAFAGLACVGMAIGQVPAPSTTPPGSATLTTPLTPATEAPPPPPAREAASAVLTQPSIAAVLYLLGMTDEDIGCATPFGSGGPGETA